MATSDAPTLDPAPRTGIARSERRDVLSVRDVPVPTTDPVARAGSEIIGGPVGRYASVGRVLPWRPAAVTSIIVATLMLGLGMLQKGYCVTNGWSVPGTFWRACYSDMPFLFVGTPLAQGGFPYGAQAAGGIGQPPLTGLLMWLTAKAVPGGDPAHRQLYYFLLWGALIALCLALTVRAVALAVRREPWRAMHVAATPLLVTSALVSPDMIAVALTAYGLLLWSRGHSEAAGVLLGLAVAAKTVPLLIVLAIGVLACRAGRLREWAALLGAGMLSYVAAVVLTFGAGSLTGALRGPGDLPAVFSAYRQWASSGPDYGALLYIPRAMGLDIPPATAVGLSIFGWVVALAAGATLALSARRRPTIAEVSLVIVGIVFCTGRALPVQASLWLVPLVALAGLRWRDHLVWVAGELLYFVAIWIHLGGQSDPNRTLPLAWLVGFSMLRLAGIVWLIVAAWRQASARGALAAPDETTEVARASEASEAGVGRRLRTEEPGSGAGLHARDPLGDFDDEVGRSAREAYGDLPGERDDLVLDPAREPDPLAGPFAGRGDRFTITFS